MDWEIFEPDPADFEEFGNAIYSAAYCAASNRFSQQCPSLPLEGPLNTSEHSDEENIRPSSLTRF